MATLAQPENCQFGLAFRGLGSIIFVTGADPPAPGGLGQLWLVCHGLGYLDQKNVAYDVNNKARQETKVLRK